MAKSKKQPFLSKLLFGKKKEFENEIRFLHIGKTAGSQIRSIIDQVNALSPDRKILKHGHYKFLHHIPEDREYFFSIRHPLTRYYSGFYSRKRKGMPRNFREHTIYDAFAFAEFEEANDLAEALFEPGERGHKAAAAIKSILHTGQNQFDWFVTCGAFLYTRPPIHIIRQEKFNADMAVFFKRAGLEHIWDRIEIAEDGVKAHRNDYSATPPLSDKAKENLTAWYAQDLAFHRMCEDWLAEREAETA